MPPLFIDKIMSKRVINYKAGHRKRLKERFLSAPESLPDYELLELILFNAFPRRDVKPYAKELINKFGNFSTIINLDPTKTKDLENNITNSVDLQFNIIKESIRRVLKGNIRDVTLLNNITSVYDYLRMSIGQSNVEHFKVLYLNTKNHLIADELMQSGTVDQTTIYPREIVKRAIYHDASAVIITHNHPSGVAKPSSADITITHKIVNACKAVDIKVHDHIIVARNKIFSFKTENLL